MWVILVVTGILGLANQDQLYLQLHVTSLKLTANAPENWWLEDDPFLLGRPIFRGELLVSGRVCSPNLKEFSQSFVFSSLM